MLTRADLTEQELNALNNWINQVKSRHERALQNDLAYIEENYFKQTEYFRATTADPSKKDKMLELQWGLSAEAWDAGDPVR